MKRSTLGLVHRANNNLLRNSLFTFIFLLFANYTFSANITIANTAIVDQDTAGHYAFVQLDLAWDASWRTSTLESNWDAAWVFVKFRTGVSGDWQHATLSALSGEHVSVAGAAIDATAQGKGVFIYRSSNGLGSNAWSGLKLRWYYGSDGLADTDSMQVKVLCIEMVYVPQGSFWLGDGSSTGTFRQTGSNTPVQITTSPVTVMCENTSYDDGALESTGTGILVDGDNGIDTLANTTVNNAGYPTGYNAFYCMKYEISMGQYTDFLNLLTRTQQNTRTGSNVSADAIANIYVMSNTATLSNRNTIACPASGNGTTAPVQFTTTTPDRACNYLSWMDGCAYADWAGLRPMTELEFEKACRGPQTAVSGEYAWGNTNIHATAYTLTNDGANTAAISNMGTSTGNASYSTTDGAIDGPLRNGIFAWSAASKTRQETGATYYGIMEMSGNLYERSITLGNTSGRRFTGLSGNGALTANGNADVTNWAGMVGGELTGATGAGFRGGSWGYGASLLQLSDRSYGAYADDTRGSLCGSRGVRSAP